jgi:Kef-type K+ transport system membrane component KefB
MTTSRRVCALCGRLFAILQRIGQTAVLGELLAGVIIGTNLRRAPSTPRRHPGEQAQNSFSTGIGSRP